MAENVSNAPQVSENERYGSLTFFKAPTQYPQYTLYVQANMNTGTPPSNGWFSSITS